MYKQSRQQIKVTEELHLLVSYTAEILFNDPDRVFILSNNSSTPVTSLLYLQDVSRGYSTCFISYKDVKTVTIATENVDFIDFTYTKPENNLYEPRITVSLHFCGHSFFIRNNHKRM